MYRSLLLVFFCTVNIFTFSQLRNDSLTFVGEKISEQSYSPPQTGNDTIKIVYLDYAIKVKYRILYKLNGNYDHDTIEFISFDHNGDFYFTKPKYVLLSVKKMHDGDFYLPKDQYKTIAKTVDGKWAFRGNDIRLDRVLMTKVIFEPMLFKDEFAYVIKKRKRLRKRFPRNYYRKENDKMIPIKGVPVDKIFQVLLN